MKHSAPRHLFFHSIVRRQEFFFIKKLLADIPRAEVYVVGGAVRDHFLGRETKDYDFVVRNVSLARLRAFLARHGAVNLVGKKFGVLKFSPRKGKRISDQIVDIALPRTEFSIGNTGHYRDFSVQSNPFLPIEEDLSRRDFTINALAWDIKEGKCIDPFGGQMDLKKRLIRAVGKPTSRFAEDYSRVLRAVRFACTLRFSIEEETQRAIPRIAKKLNDELPPSARTTKKIDRNTLRVVPYEVIAKEMVKAFCADPVRSLDLYDMLGIFRVLTPELLTMKKCPHDPRWHSEGDVWTHTRLALARLASAQFRKEFPGAPLSPLLVFAVLFHDVGKPATIQIPGRDNVDRIRYIGHDRVGADIARRAVERLRLASVEGMSVDADLIHWLVKNHLLILNAPIQTMRNNTIERYFYTDPVRGLLLRQLMFVDGFASLQKNLHPGLQAYRKFKKKIAAFEKRNTQGAHLPPSFLDGDQIMALCRIKAGARVGELKMLLREEQLAGRIESRSAARVWLKKQCK